MGLKFVSDTDIRHVWTIVSQICALVAVFLVFLYEAISSAGGIEPFDRIIRAPVALFKWWKHTTDVGSVESHGCMQLTSIVFAAFSLLSVIALSPFNISPQKRLLLMACVLAISIYGAIQFAPKFSGKLGECWINQIVALLACIVVFSEGLYGASLMSLNMFFVVVPIFFTCFMFLTRNRNAVDWVIFGALALGVFAFIARPTLVPILALSVVMSFIIFLVSHLFAAIKCLVAYLLGIHVDGCGFSGETTTSSPTTTSAPDNTTTTPSPDWGDYECKAVTNPLATAAPVIAAISPSVSFVLSAVGATNLAAKSSLILNGLAFILVAVSTVFDEPEFYTLALGFGFSFIGNLYSLVAYSRLSISTFMGLFWLLVATGIVLLLISFSNDCVISPPVAALSGVSSILPLLAPVINAPFRPRSPRPDSPDSMEKIRRNAQNLGELAEQAERVADTAPKLPDGAPGKKESDQNISDLKKAARDVSTRAKQIYRVARVGGRAGGFMGLVGSATWAYTQIVTLSHMRNSLNSAVETVVEQTSEIVKNRSLLPESGLKGAEQSGVFDEILRYAGEGQDFIEGQIEWARKQGKQDEQGKEASAPSSPPETSNRTNPFSLMIDMARGVVRPNSEQLHESADTLRGTPLEIHAQSATSYFDRLFSYVGDAGRALTRIRKDRDELRKRGQSAVGDL